MTLYHLADKADFQLNPNFKPQNNSTMGGDWPEPGLFVTKDAHGIEGWVNGYGYWRPWVVELEGNVEVKSFGGGDNFVPATEFGKLRVSRVVPLDAFCRELYGALGWTESHYGTYFDTFEKIPEDVLQNDWRAMQGYRYSGDARNTDRSWQDAYKKRVRSFARTRNNAYASLSSPSEGALMSVEASLIELYRLASAGSQWVDTSGQMQTYPGLTQYVISYGFDDGVGGGGTVMSGLTRWFWAAEGRDSVQGEGEEATEGEAKAKVEDFLAQHNEMAGQQVMFAKRAGVRDPAGYEPTGEITMLPCDSCGKPVAFERWQTIGGPFWTLISVDPATGSDLYGVWCADHLHKAAAKEPNMTTKQADSFWDEIDRQIEELKSAKSAADVARILGAGEPGVAAGGTIAFFAGGGGDANPYYSLVDAGWRTLAYDAEYYWSMQAPNGDVISYVEGDIYSGNQLVSQGARKQAGDYLATPDEITKMRAVSASDLKPGDRWFNPGMGSVVRESGDGSISIDGFHPDGWTFTVQSVNGGTVTAVNDQTGEVMTQTIPSGHKVYKMAKTAGDFSHDDFYDDHSPFRDEPRQDQSPEPYSIKLQCDKCGATATLRVSVGDESPPTCPNGHGYMRTPAREEHNAMSTDPHREALLREALQYATPAEAIRITAELDQLQGSRRQRREAGRALDWDAVESGMPNRVAARATALPDALAATEAVQTPVEVRKQANNEADRWLMTAGTHLLDVPSELERQAVDYANVWGSQFVNSNLASRAFTERVATRVATLPIARTAVDVEGAEVCQACADGDHDECTGGSCMCIDMEHDED
jgi:hypothetical protein